MLTQNDSVLFSSLQLGDNTLKNRVVMAPLTRCRATKGIDAPNELNAIYYAQRASAGLIISEATQISPTAKGYAWTPGLYSQEQIRGWKRVTDVVHAKGGVIYAQLWHVGRISHPSLQPNQEKPVAPSALIPKGLRTFIENGTFAEIDTPRALLSEEIATIIHDYRMAARNAILAGFDGVEIHAANGYLIQQFLSDGSNQRDDRYGGSIENRIRFALEVTQAVTTEIGANRTGIRISPISASNGIHDSDPKPLYIRLIQELNKLKLVYVHIVEGTAGGTRDFNGFDFQTLKSEFNGAWIVNNGYNKQMAVDALTQNKADLIAFGKPFIANPDLVERFKNNVPLNQPDPSSFYGGCEAGYTDYPLMTPSVDIGP